MADIRCMEHHTLKVPYEILNKKFRSTQKALDKEASQVQSVISDLEKAVKDCDHGDVPTFLAQIEERLVQLSRKAQESVTEEVEAAECCRRRVQHLAKGCNSVNQSQISQWKRTRLDRMLVEHFLRSGNYESAITLARSADIEDLTNINLFLVAKEVEESLSRRDMSKCLAWCQDNKSKLRKMKSSLEFNVRLQEFTELIKADKRFEAVHHARKYLAIEDADQLSKVQKACALLAFPVDTPILRYKEMFDSFKWQDLVEQFRAENYRLYQLSNQSVFTVALQAGLSALKTPHCYRPFGDRNYECPVCQTPLNELAAPLPFAHCSQSRLICAASGKPMNENNHPMMLPNGYVYGEKALEKMATENDNGDVKCPRTKEVFHVSAAQKVYVM